MRVTPVLVLAVHLLAACGDTGQHPPTCPPGSTDPECLDGDGDGVPDISDNCPSVANADQTDSDNDSVGDACDVPDKDSDGDGVPDASDNCPKVANPGQADSDKNGIGDACQEDRDKDGIPDSLDNCPDQKNPGQADYNDDNQGDACTPQDGTMSHPFIIPVAGRHFTYTVERDTTGSPSDAVDVYPPSDTDESGPEHFYAFRIDAASRVTAEVSAPEPAGVDIDVHLLESVTPIKLVERNNLVTYGSLVPGVYHLSLDSYKGKTGEYVLDFAVRPKSVPASETFNSYMLKAVKQLHKDFGLLGYTSAELTHDIAYGGHGDIKAMKPPRTMCVAAVMEILLTAMQIYATETGDSSVFDFLPMKSYESLASSYIRAHLWVNFDINSRGSADAARHFGMGMTVPFQELTPGSVINLNRTNGTGHAVVFLAFIDVNGKEYDSWDANMVGFKYFSSQGGYDAGAGGLDYRYAVFDQHDSPAMPYKRDLHIIDSKDQLYLNTGVFYHPDLWMKTSWSDPIKNTSSRQVLQSEFDSDYFDGVTADD